MQISGLVITLDLDAEPGSLQDALSARPEFVVGEAHDRWLAVAMEAPDEAGSWALHEWLRALPGVAHVDVVHVHFETEDGAEEPLEHDRESVAGDPEPLERKQTPRN
jgi:nitrate reductase NapAB chaperone NapD